MKTKHLIPTLFSLACICVSVGQEPVFQAPTLQDARVTLPLGELRQLWQAADTIKRQPKESKPPIDVSITSGRYQLDLASNPPRLTATWILHQYSNGWQLIPLIGGDLHLQSHQPEDASLLFRDDKFALLRSQAGSYQIQLNTVLTQEVLASKQGLTLCTVEATSNRLEVVGLPENEQLLVNGKAAASHVFMLANEAASYTLTKRGKANEVTLEPSSWSSQSETVVRLVNGHLRFTSRTYLSASQGNGLTGTLTLPTASTDIVTTGHDLDTTALGDRPDGLREITLQWKTPHVRSRVVEVTYTQPLPPFYNTWTVRAPTAPETQRNIFVIALPPKLDLLGEGLISSPQAHQLTLWLRNQIGDEPAALIVRTGEPSAQIETQLQTARNATPAIIPKATFITRLVADGSLIVEASYLLQHDVSTNFDVQLPSGAELLLARVDDIATAPESNNSAVTFKLPNPNGETSNVVFSYTMKLTALDPVTGNLTLSLPQTSLFIDHLNWALTLPEAYEIEAIDGNVERGSDQAISEATIHLVKDLCRNERPGIELYYRRQGLSQ